MDESNSYSGDSGLFADKGQAVPTHDYVPRLKTDEPAQLDASAELSDEVAEAKPLPGTDGLLGGLIRRRTEPQQVLPSLEQAAVEASRHVDPEAAEIAKSVSEHIDNGMLYESLKMGLPLPKLGKAMTNAEVDGEKPKSFGEAARERVARPTTSEPSGTVPPAHTNKTGLNGNRAVKAHRNPKRHQLTARLSIEDFQRFKIYADESGRTYQDILATATTSYLDVVAPGSRSAEASAAPEKNADTKADPLTATPASPGTDPIAVKSPYDWFRRE